MAALLIQDNSGSQISPPRVSVIVCNFNGRTVLDRCVSTLLQQDFSEAYEIILVDDASNDGSVEQLRLYREEPGVRLLELPVNLGISGARNEGIQIARGEILAFLDNDGFAHSSWIREAMRIFDSESSLGALASAVYFEGREKILNGFGGGLNSRWVARDLEFGKPDDRIEALREVVYPMGCGMFVRRSAIEKFSNFDPLQRRWYDDVDLGISVWLSGSKVLACRAAKVDHVGHVSSQTTKNDLLSRFLRPFRFETSRIRTVFKCCPRSEFAQFLLAEATFVLKALLSGNWRHLLVLLAAWSWNLAHVPSALRIRRRLGATPDGYAAFCRVRKAVLPGLGV